MWTCDHCGAPVETDTRPDPLDFLLCDECVEHALAERQLMEQAA